MDRDRLHQELQAGAAGPLADLRTSLRTDLDGIISGILGGVSTSRHHAERTRAERIRATAPFRRVAMKDVDVQVEFVPWVNYSLMHCGLPQIHRLLIRNGAGEDLTDVLIKVWIPDYGDMWQKTIPSIGAGVEHVEEAIRIQINKKRLQAVTEAENAALQIEVSTDERKIYAGTYDIHIHAYNHWVYHPNCPELLASFVMPNNAAVEKAVEAAKPHLKELCGKTSFDGYQSGDPSKVDCIAKSLFQAMQEELNITYINPPPSFERSGQKIYLPDRVVGSQQGTCLDLALFYAAGLERTGLAPVIFLVTGHAFLGYWRSEGAGFDAPSTGEWELVVKAVTDGLLVPVNSTTFTAEQRDFEDAVAEATGYLKESDAFDYLVDVGQSRRHGIRPMD